MDLSGRRLALSFDNGPFPDVTPGVLDTLADFGVRATFFVCGKDIETPERRALLARAKREGHRIGNHTQTHSIEFGACDDPDAPAREIEQAQAALGEFTEPECWFRPYGAGGVLGPRLLSRAAVKHLVDGGYSCVLWNCVPRDWEDPRGWAERALADMARRDETLVVLHDVPTGAMAALPGFLERALDAGAEISEELPTGCVPIRSGAVVGPLDGLVNEDSR